MLTCWQWMLCGFCPGLEAALDSWCRSSSLQNLNLTHEIECIRGFSQIVRHCGASQQKSHQEKHTLLEQTPGPSKHWSVKLRYGIWTTSIRHYLEQVQCPSKHTVKLGYITLKKRNACGNMHCRNGTWNVNHKPTQVLGTSTMPVKTCHGSTGMCNIKHQDYTNYLDQFAPRSMYLQKICRSGICNAEPWTTNDNP